MNATDAATRYLVVVEGPDTTPNAHVTGLYSAISNARAKAARTGKPVTVWSDAGKHERTRPVAFVHAGMEVGVAHGAHADERAQIREDWV